MKAVRWWTRSGVRRWLLLLAVAGLAMGLGTWWRVGRLPPVGAQVGQRAPDFTLTTLDGQPVSLADFRGQVVLIEFWQSTCPDCLEALPHTAELARRFQDRGLVLLGVNLDHDPQAAQAALAQLGLAEVMITLGGNLDRAMEVVHLFEVPLVPHVVLVDRRGIIRFSATFPEVITPDIIEEWL